MEDYAVADDGLSILYAIDGTICVLAADSDEAIQVGSYSNGVELLAVSNDGSFAVWAFENDDGTCGLAMVNAEESTVLKEAEETLDVSVIFSSDQALALVISTDTMWIRQPDKETEKVKLGGEFSSEAVYTGTGLLSERAALEIDSLYLSVANEAGDLSVYKISMDGDREKVVTGVDEFCIVSGYLFYMDSDSSLYYGDLSGNGFDGERLSTNMYTLSTGSDYVYYLKNYESLGGTLYAYQIGAGEAVKVDTSVYWSFRICADGTAVYYIKDIERLARSTYIYAYYGELYSWDYAAGESVFIASDTLSGTMNSGLYGGYLNAQGFVFEKYSYRDESGNIRVDLAFYDGNETCKIVPDLFYQNIG